VAWPGHDLHREHLPNNQSEWGVLSAGWQLRDIDGRGVRGPGRPVPRTELGVRTHDLPTGDGRLLPGRKSWNPVGLHPDDRTAVR
jgi:hypothetical protein